LLVEQEYGVQKRGARVLLRAYMERTTGVSAERSSRA